MKTETETHMKIEVKQLEEMTMAALVDRGEKIDFQGTWHALRPAVKAAGLEKKGASFVSVFNASTLTNAGKMEWYAAAMMLDDANAKPSAPLATLRVQGGKFASWVYEGPLEGLGAAWPSFASELAAKGHKTDTSRPCFEIYLEEGASARTELFVPVA